MLDGIGWELELVVKWGLDYYRISGSVDGLILLMDCETWWDGMRIVEWALWSFYNLSMAYGIGQTYA